MADTLTTAAAMIKPTFSKAMENVMFDKEHRPFLTAVRKSKVGVGSGLTHPVEYGNSNLISADSSVALASAGSGKIVKFTFSAFEKYGKGEVSLPLMEEAKANGPTAFAGYIEACVKSAIEKFANQTAAESLRGGTGTVGRVAATSGLGGTLTLDDPNTWVNFDVGDLLQLSHTDGGALLDSGNYVEVTAINGGVDSSTLTLGGNLSGISGAAVGDYIIKKGNSNAVIQGIAAMNPYTAPTNGDSVYGAGVDRSVNVAKLAGSRVDGSSLRIDEALVKLAWATFTAGGRPDTLVLHPIQTYNLMNTRDSKVRVDDSGKFTVGGSDVTILAGPLRLKLMSDPSAETSYGRVVRMSDWELRSSPMGFGELAPGGINGILDRAYDSFNYQFRIFGRGILWCTTPVNNGVALLPTV